MPDHERRGPTSKHRSQGAGDGANQSALDKHELNQPRPAGADGDTERHLANARLGAASHQVRQVDTCDHQDQNNHERQNCQRPAILALQTGVPRRGRFEKQLGGNVVLVAVARPMLAFYTLEPILALGGLQLLADDFGRRPGARWANMPNQTRFG